MQSKQAKQIILNEVAANGAVTAKAMRMYCEHKISNKTFNELISEGLKIYGITKRNRG